MDSLITAHADTRELDVVLRRMAAFADREALDIAASETISAIDSKSRRGVGPDGSYFGGYISRHKQKREKAGLQTDHVDLHFTDAMMRSLERVGDTVTVGSQHQLQAEGLHERYGFMGVGGDTVKAIEHQITRALDRSA